MKKNNAMFLIIFLSLVTVCIIIGFGIFLVNKQMKPNRDTSTSQTSNNEQLIVQTNKIQLVTLETIEIADSSAEHQTGLQNRKDLCDNCGMLFVFKSEEPRTFWMKDTSLSLDIIFIDQSGEVVSIAENTTPLSTNPLYKSEKPARYVLEVNAGWSKKNSISKGDSIDIDYLISKGVEYNSNR